ncbi:MAG: formylglycine-generating enzyme family protein [Rhodomicrobium sp.]|nr:formylglycine-generating enzyme family protein [Rhodomicrobium sp.]
MLGDIGNAGPPQDFALLKTAPLARQTAPQSWQAREDMIFIPAGRYHIGRDDGPADERPAHQVSLSAFRIDRTEVTNAAFAEFLNALALRPQDDFRAGEIGPDHFTPSEFDRLREGNEGSGLYPIIALDDDQARIGVSKRTFVPTPGHENHPVAETTWAGARAYCVWRGGRLPSEAEWEAAARGFDRRLYPWGDEPPSPERAFVSRRTGVTSEVGQLSAGASPFGALDMSGNLAEWTSTLKRPYPYRADDGREDQTVSGERVTRGGDYRYDTSAERLTATHRNGFSNAPERGHRHIGFRCAATR